MIPLFSGELNHLLYDVNIFSVCLRLALAVLLGGAIGLERGFNSHPAGFRTHILVCVGSTLVMLTDQYLYVTLASNADPARLGAQVITGVGFLGAGTIFATGKHKIKGLTTAAGLWASACLGLALGIGFYSGAIITALLIIISLAYLPKVEKFIYDRGKNVRLYVEAGSPVEFRNFADFISSMEIQVLETHISSRKALTTDGVAFHMTLKFPKNLKLSDVLPELNNYPGIFLVEEL